MDRLTLVLVGGVLVLVGVGLGAAVIVSRNAVPPDLGSPGGVALAYELAEQRGDGQAAWNLLASSTQARADRDRFLARAGNYRPNDQSVSVEDMRIDGDEATVTLLRSRPRSGIFDGGYSYSQTFRLVREPDGWRITVPPDEYALIAPPGGKP